MPEPFCRIAFITLFCLLCSLRTFYKIKVHLFRERIYSREENVGYIVARSILGVPLLLAVFLYAFLPDRYPWMYLWLPIWLRLVGVIGGAGAILLLVWVHQALGRNFTTSLTFRKDHRMVTHGPYAWVRHPMYSAYFTLFLAAFMVSENWIIGVTGLSIILMLMTFRLVREEALLIDRFGEEYRRYRRTTGKFLPSVSGLLRLLRRLGQTREGITARE